MTVSDGMSALDLSTPDYCPSCGAAAAPAAAACARCGAPLAYQVESAEARTLLAELGRALEGRYLVGDVLGSGRGGITVCARHTASKRDVAIKVAWNDATARTQVLRETILTAKVSHPNALAVRDIQAPEPMLVVEMPLAAGGTLSDLLAAGKPVPFVRVLEIVRAIGGALDQAHAAGIIHGGLRPIKILLDETGKPLVSDFEIRSPRRADWDVSRPSEVGAQAYMPLEQRHDAPTVDGRIDQYALAIIAYELLRGHTTWRINAEGVLEIDAIEIIVHRPIGPDVPLSASMAIKRATAKDPAYRYASVGAFVRVFSGEAGDVVPREQIHRADEARKERRSLSWILVPAVLGLALLGMKSSVREAAVDLWHGDWSFGRSAASGTDPSPAAPSEPAPPADPSRNESNRAPQSSQPSNTRVGETTPAASPTGILGTQAAPNQREQPSNSRAGASTGGSNATRQSTAQPPATSSSSGSGGSASRNPPNTRPPAGGTSATQSRSATDPGAKAAPQGGDGFLVVTLDADTRGVVVVDGRPRGPAPMTLRLPSGQHVVTVRAPDGSGPASKTITLAAGDTTRANFSLRRP